MTTILLLNLIAFAGPPPTETPPVFEPADPLSPQKPDSGQTLDVEVSIDKAPSGKKFQGVWLVQEDGSRWIVSYRSTPLWRIYDATRVTVTGETYEPDGQSIDAAHFRVDTLRIVDPQGVTDPQSFGPERSLNGRFENVQGSPGSKSEGSVWSVFTVDGGLSYEIMNPVAVDREATTVRARTVQRSPFVARRGGPTLWLVSP